MIVIRIRPNLKTLKMALIEGEVKEVFEELFCFKVNNTMVHAILNSLEDPLTKLPKKGAKVKITSQYFYSNGFNITHVILVPGKSTVQGSFLMELSIGYPFYNLIKNINPTPEHILQFAKNFDNFNKYFKSIWNISKEKMYINIINRLNGNVNFQLIFPSNIQLICDEGNQTDLTFYTFGVHRRESRHSHKSYLFGLLLRSERDGVVYLTDSQQKIPCVILNKWSESDCYVLIEEFIVITEIYNGLKLTSLEYLLIDIGNLLKLESRTKTDCLPTEEFLQSNKFNKLTCQIVKKSLYIATSSTQSEFWLELNKNDRNKCFLSIDSSFIKVYNTLKIGHNYDVFFKTKPNQFMNKEVSAVNPSIPQYKLSPNSFFISRTSNVEQPTILNTSEAISSLQSSNIISFEATILLKKFVSSNSSRTQKVTNDPQFGTPGEKTHVLEFETDSKPLTLYLNNWENLCAPYGLIPNMRVIVHNVKPQSGKYFKSTVMTSFEIIKYEPKVRFESALLSHCDWGLPYFFGSGELIPRDTIIWSRILNFFILGLKIYPGKNGQLDPTITLICFDAIGESKILAKNKNGLDLLQFLLGMHRPAFDKWCQSFYQLGVYSYYKNIDLKQITDEGLEGTIARRLTLYLSTIEKRNWNFELKCRKLDNEATGKPVFYFLEARNISK